MKKRPDHLGRSLKTAIRKGLDKNSCNSEYVRGLSFGQWQKVDRLYQYLFMRTYDIASRHIWRMVFVQYHKRAAKAR